MGEFTFRDLTALAIIQQLVDYNVGVERAGQLAESALNAVWRLEYEMNPKLAAPSGDAVVDPKGPPPLPSRLYLLVDNEGQERICWGTAGDLVDADSWVVIDAHRTISSAIMIALESIEHDTSPDVEKKLIEQLAKNIEAVEEAAAQKAKLAMEAAKQATMQTVQAALRGAGISIEFARDGTVRVLPNKPKAVSGKRRSKKKAKS